MPDNRTEHNRTRSLDPYKVKRLRELTGESMMDCKRALFRADGDLEKAREGLSSLGHGGCRLVNPVRRKSSYEKGLTLLQEIWDHMPCQDKQWFLKTDPMMMHFNLGAHLRNECGMWNQVWVADVIDGVDYAIDHPDAVSMRVIRDFQALVIKAQTEKGQL